MSVLSSADSLKMLVLGQYWQHIHGDMDLKGDKKIT